jgi:uncharacterized SAM-binding protein YcdF (DUF218 family)
MNPHDAVLVLGGGVREGGALPSWAEARFDLAFELQPEGPFVCLSAGTTHRPPPLEDGFPIAESVAGARYLLSRGVPASRIRIENASYDTIGNAYFAKVMHVDPCGWCRLLVITTEFHMPRTRAIFEWVFGFERGRYELDFAASADSGDVEFRRRKEAEALEGFRRVQPGIRSLRQLHEWLFTDHQAYAAGGRWRGQASRDPRVLDFY